MDIEHFDNVNNGLFFSISVNYKTTDSSLDDNGTSGGNSSDKVSTNDVATKDTATKDTANKTTDNGTVQTGNPMTAVSVALVMLVASGAMFVCYRRKIEK